MKIIYCKHIPPKGYTAMTLWPWIIIREDSKKRFTAKTVRHECTHGLQQIETLWILFILIYCIEWVVKLPFCGFNGNRAYRSISFEQEAYEHEDEFGYNHVRKHYAWVRYVFSLV